MSVKSKISVIKFGGTSVKSIARINHVVDIVAKLETKCVVVVSAMGDTTDYLYDLAKKCSTAPNKREVDQLLSTGEQVSIALLSIALQDRGIKAKSFTGQQIGIKTDGLYSCARIVDICKETIRAALEENDVIVVAGFQGQGENGEVTTLGRGGSDTSAVALAAAAGADECHIYTDVDGIYTTDPNKIPQAKLLQTISYVETIELARAGAQVLHPRAAELAKDFGIKLRVRNTFKPEHKGTLIGSGENNVERICKVKGVAVDAHQAYVSIDNVNATYPFLTECEKLFAKDSIVIDSISQLKNGQGQRCVQLSVRYADETLFKSILDELKLHCGADDIAVDLNVARVSLIGAGIGGAASIRSRALSLLEQEKIDVLLFSGSESSISVLIDDQYSGRATQVLHDEFIGIQTDEDVCAHKPDSVAYQHIMRQEVS